MMGLKSSKEILRFLGVESLTFSSMPLLIATCASGIVYIKFSELYKWMKKGVHQNPAQVSILKPILWNPTNTLPNTTIIFFNYFEW